MSSSNLKSLIWLFISILVAIVIQVPMLWHGAYAFSLPNALIAVITILYLRNSLDFYQISLHKNKWVRYIILVLNILAFVYILNRLELIMGIIDSMDMRALIKSDTITLNESVELFRYIHFEYLALSISSFVAIVIYNLKLLSSFWRRSNLKREQQL